MRNVAVIAVVNLLLLVLQVGYGAAVDRPIRGDSRPQSDAVDFLGDTVTIGTTWYEQQHNGTIGRMVEGDGNDYLHFTWTNGLNEQAVDRHVYYNFIDPLGNQGWPGTGCPIEAMRSGYANLDIDANGNPLIAYHRYSPFWMTVRTAVYVGSFTYLEPPLIGGLGLIYPRMQMDRNGLIHVVAALNDTSAPPGSPGELYYISVNSDSTWTFVSYTMTSAAEVAVSDVSDRVAFGWTYCMDEGFPWGTGFSTVNNDIWLLIDDDGQDLRFDDAFNLTQFIPPDSSWLPNTLYANMDTLRAYVDLCLFFDQDDWLHAAFTTRAVFLLQGITYWNASLIWHWSEQFPGEYQTVANAFDPDDLVCCGAWNVKAQRPSLGQDPATGYLYCMYQQYDTDTSALSAAGWPSGEVYISVSTDGGLNWSVGTNVTQTVTSSGAFPYQCWSELCPTMAKVVDDTCSIMYVLDQDAGSVVQNEGSWTLNPVKYHKVPADLIPTTPLMPQWPYHPDGVPFHVEHGVFVESSESDQPGEFALKDPFPDPFNPTTTFSFTLPVVSWVKLEVFDIQGRHVGARPPRPYTERWYTSGLHQIIFDGCDLPSGVYVYRLNAGEFQATGKMVLLK